MTQWSQSVVATGATTSMDSQPVPVGTMWTVAMLSIETLPIRSGMTCVIRRNGRLVTSTPLGSADTAYGPPPIILGPRDLLNTTWTGTQAGDDCTLTLYYTEIDWTANPSAQIVV